MIVAVPAFFSPEEAAGGHAKELLRRAVDEAAAASGISRVLVVGDDETLLETLSGRRIRKMNRPVRTAGVPAPIGAEAARAAGGSSEDLLILEPRNPFLDRTDLADAAQRLKHGDAPYLLSAGEPLDHPCQGKQFFKVKDTGAIRIFENRHSAAFVTASLLPGARGDASGRPDLRLRGLGFGALSGAKILLFEDEAGKACLRFQDYPPADGLVLQVHDFTRGMAATTRSMADGSFRLDGLEMQAGDRLIWSLLQEVPAGPYEFRLVYEPETAPWKTDPSGLRPMDVKTGEIIRGRQDFPEVYEPDGSLLGIRAGTAFPERTSLMREGFTVFALPPKRSLVIRNELDVIKWEINRNAA